MNKTEEQ